LFLFALMIDAVVSLFLGQAASDGDFASVSAEQLQAGFGCPAARLFVEEGEMTAK
jgi:hypothetical protein